MEVEKHRFTEKIYTLILKSHINALDKVEEAELERWRKQSPDNENLYNQLSDKQYLKKRYIDFRETRHPDGWQKLKQRIEPERNKKYIWRHIFKYAAIILLAIGSGIAILTTQKSNDTLSSLQESLEQPEQIEAILELSNGSKITLNKHAAPPAKMLEELGIITNEDELIYQNSKTSKEVEYHTLRVPNGGKYKLELADGTIVWMNSVSALHYPAQFDGDERRVQLEGEAYFKVSKNPAKPFIVESGEINICVTGTEFNIKAYPEEKQIATTLVNGGVTISQNGNDIALTPGNQAIYYEKNEMMEIHPVNTALYTSWKDGVFEFEDMALTEICSQLERWYDVEFIFTDSSLNELTFSGAAKREKSLEFILDIISKTNTITFEIKNKEIILNKKK